MKGMERKKSRKEAKEVTNEGRWKGTTVRGEGRMDEWPGNPDRFSPADPTETVSQYRRSRRA